MEDNHENIFKTEGGFGFLLSDPVADLAKFLARRQDDREINGHNPSEIDKHELTVTEFPFNLSQLFFSLRKGTHMINQVKEKKCKLRHD